MGILEKWKKAARYGYKHPSCQILNPSQCRVMAEHWQTKVYACMILFRLPHCNWKKNHWSWNSFPKTQRLFFLKMLMYPVCVPTQELHQRSNLQLSQSTPIIEVFAPKIVCLHAILLFIYYMFFLSFLKVAPEEKKLLGAKAKVAPEKSRKSGPKRKQGCVTLGISASKHYFQRVFFTYFQLTTKSFNVM